MMRVRDYAALAALAAAAACSSSTAPQQNNGKPCAGNEHQTVVSLAVGGVAALTVPANLNCISLATSDATDGSFLVIAANADTKPDVTGQYNLGVSQPATLAEDVIAAAHRQSAVTLGQTSDTGSIAEGRFRALERRSLRLDVPGVRASESRFMRQARTGVHAAAVPNVGDTLSFKVPDANAQNACVSFTSERAVVKTVGVHGIIVQDITAPTGGFNTPAFDSIETEFDQIIYPTDVAHFGNPSDIDGNGHVFLFFTPQVNAATPRGSHNILAGFFFDGDLFPITGPNSCGESNLGEIFYLLTPDPSPGQFGDPRSTQDVRQTIRGVVAHEFQHMINAGVRAIQEGAPDDAVWMNEALSHFAEELVGRAEDGFTDTEKLTINDVADEPSLNNFHAFFGQNMARLRDFMADPSSLGATSAHADTSLAVRGAAWSLLRYSADQYAHGNVPAFTRALVAGPDTGVANLAARTGTSFDSVVAGWLPALYTSDDSITGLPNRYTFPSWDIRSIEPAVNNGTFPLIATTITAGNTAAGTVSSAAANYYLVGVPASQTVLLGELAPNGGAVTFRGARVYIVRLR